MRQCLGKLNDGCLYLSTIYSPNFKVGFLSSTGTHWPEIAAGDQFESEPGCHVSFLQLRPVHFSHLPQFLTQDLSQFHCDVVSTNLYYRKISDISKFNITIATRVTHIAKQGHRNSYSQCTQKITRSVNIFPTSTDRITVKQHKLEYLNHKQENLKTN